jgi:O-antigen/teichoic acid export membrane protein
VKYKYFLKNLSIFTISNFITKLLMFLMLPLYTSILTSKEYGTIDMITTTVNLAMPILTLCITEAIIRFTIEENTNKKQILLNSLNIAFKGYILLLLISAVAWLLGMELKTLILFNIYYLVYTVSSLLTYYLKGLERIKIIGWASVIRVIALILLNCLLLLYFKLSVVGYYASLIISDMIVIIIYICNLKKYKVISNEEKDTALKKEMVKYSKNFVLNSISWWINNASDKYILLLFYDLNITGIYSVAYKIPTIIEFVQAIYSQAWQISAIKEYDKENSAEFFSNMYKIYNIIILFFVCLILIFLKVIAKILFAKEFFIAWKYVPFLLLAILFGALSGFLGSIYAANKDSKMYAKSTAVGAIANIALNFSLIPNFGAQGAAIATCISYITVWILRLVFMKKYIVLDINLKKDLFSYLLILVMCICIICFRTLIAQVISISILIILLLIYKKELVDLFRSVRKDFMK